MRVCVPQFPHPFESTWPGLQTPEHDASGTLVSGRPESSLPESGVPASGIPASGSAMQPLPSTQMKPGSQAPMRDAVRHTPSTQRASAQMELGGVHSESAAHSAMVQEPSPQEGGTQSPS